MSNKLRRRIVVSLDLHADSWSAAIDELDNIAFRLAEARDGNRHPIRLTAGGYNTGYTLNADEDETVTHASYFAAIEQARAGVKVSVKDAIIADFELANKDHKP